MRHYLKVELLALYDSREADAIVKLLFDHYLNWSPTDLMVKLNDGLSESEILLFHQALKKLKQGIPVQYATGSAHFMGMNLKVTPDTLIPRPETEELVRLAMDENTQPNLRVLDIGTGSGCIGLGFKKERQDAEVTLLDASQAALDVAQKNAENNRLSVETICADILHFNTKLQWDIIISNPPYIPLSEKQEMHDRVVKFEPHMALFVTDSQPLIFYERILQMARIILHPGGKIYFEIHERMADSLAKLCRDYGRNKFHFQRDMQGKNRMLIIES
jgi:release factor glutamine methyltransferase